jgi:NADH-quinone oxidoreductase subunit C
MGNEDTTSAAVVPGRLAPAALLAAAQALAPDITVQPAANHPAIVVPVAVLHQVLARLRDEPALAFDFLLAHTAADFPGTAPEAGHFQLLYQLRSMRHGHYLLVLSQIPRDNPVAPTVMDLWAVAEWQEREVYDLFGILYDGHPDLRRLLLDDEWQGHPLRKDYRDDFMLERLA